MSPSSSPARQDDSGIDDAPVAAEQRNHERRPRIAISIRPFKKRDLPDVLAVWLRASAISQPFLSDAFLLSEQLKMETVYLPVSETWVAQEDGTVVGFISLVSGVVGAIFVDPVAQHRGAGRQLMDTVRAECGSLELEVFGKNAIGRRFYARYGFRERARHLHGETGQELISLRLN